MTATSSTTKIIAPTRPLETVTQFLSALEQFDSEKAGNLIANNIVYTNVSLPTLRGKTTVLKALTRFTKVARHFDAKIHRITENNTVVLTERTDAMEFGPFRMQFWVCGTFEVQDGKITLWRDYFDWANITLATLRGILGIFIPAARAKL
ncbi:MAG: limonene-1,2-epoxide hydrolase family protein [Mycobacteriaceae bacterium]